jgi:hypothetical protein
LSKARMPGEQETPNHLLEVPRSLAFVEERGLCECSRTRNKHWECQVGADEVFVSPRECRVHLWPV